MIFFALAWIYNVTNQALVLGFTVSEACSREWAARCLMLIDMRGDRWRDLPLTSGFHHELLNRKASLPLKEMIAVNILIRFRLLSHSGFVLSETFISAERF